MSAASMCPPLVATSLEQDFPHSQIEVQATPRQCVAAQRLIAETLNEIGSYLDVSALGNLRLTCKQWANWTGADDEGNALAQRRKALLDLVALLGFGARDWEKYFGKVAPTPLPLELLEMLHGPCPIWPDRMVKDTHMLVLVPETVNDKPFTLDYLGELIEHSQGEGKAMQYGAYSTLIKEEHSSTPAPKSHWILMTRDVLEETRNKKYQVQQAVVKQYPGYEVPRGLEAATAILMEHAKTGNRLYSYPPLTFTRCQEHMQGGPYHRLIVGFFTPDGLHVRYNNADASVDSGLAGVRNLGPWPSDT